MILNVKTPVLVACGLIALAAGCGRSRQPNASLSDERVFAKIRVADAGSGTGSASRREGEVVSDAEATRRAKVRDFQKIFEKAKSPDDLLDPLDLIVRKKLFAPELVPYVARCLTHPDSDERSYGIKARAVISPGDALPDIQLVLRDKDPKVRQAAMEAIGLLPDPLPFDAVFAHLAGERDALVQQAAMIVVAARAKGPDVPRVLAIIQDLDMHAVAPVIDLLRKNPAAARPEADRLAYFLDRNDADLRMQVAKLLGEWGIRSPAVISGLVRGLSDSEVSVRKAAFEALRAMAGRDFGYNPEANADGRKDAVGLWKAWAKAQAGEGTESKPDSR
jgi:HEAT repeat protein